MLDLIYDDIEKSRVNIDYLREFIHLMWGQGYEIVEIGKIGESPFQTKTYVNVFYREREKTIQKSFEEYLKEQRERIVENE